MLQVNALSVAYGESDVLHGVGFSAAEGEIVAIMGRNGMGKSTLMKSLIGMIPHRGGTIHLGGADLSALPSHKRVENGLTIVVSERVLTFAMNVADRFLVMENGQFVDEVTAAETDEGRVAAFLSV